MQEKRGRSRTPYHHQEEDTSYSHQKDTLRRNEKHALYSPIRDKSQTPYSQHEDSLLNKDRSQIPYSQSPYYQRENSLLNRNRSRSPYY